MQPAAVQLPPLRALLLLMLLRLPVAFCASRRAPVPKQGFTPSWRRGEMSSVYAQRGTVKMRTADDVTRSMQWSEARRCTRGSSDAGSASAVQLLETAPLVIAMASDMADPLPTLAVINSTAQHSSTPEHLEFVVITTYPERLMALLESPLVRGALPANLARQVRVCEGFADMLMQRPALAQLVAVRNNTMASRVRRRELLSPFNFAAFYLPHILDAHRILYLDTDTLVQTDVHKRLATFDFENLAVAAVEDCTQRLSKYVNFGLLERFLTKRDIGGLSRERFFGESAQAQVGNETCVFNRGVVLFDAKRWRELHLTRTIEDLLGYYVKSGARLWRGGVSQPPFLLALAGRYKKLPLEWNVRGLGRVDMTAEEFELSAVGAPSRSTALLRREIYRVGAFKKKFHPFAAPLAGNAFVLHYTGELKPWRVNGDAALQWKTYGVTVTEAGHVLGACKLAPEALLMRRELFACRRARDCGNPSFRNFTSTTEVFSSNCLARMSLCPCKPTLSATTRAAPAPDCVESCSSVWYRYVNDDARRIAAADTLRASLLGPIKSSW